MRENRHRSAAREGSMDSIRLICPNCGAEIEAVANRTAIRCDRCGAAILMEDVLDDGAREQAPAPAEKAAPRQKERSLVVAAACLAVAVLGLVGACLMTRPPAAACLDGDEIPVVVDEAAVEAVDEDIGDDAIGPDMLAAVPEEEESLGERVVDRALTRLGCPYVYGKKGGEEFDCSGLVYWAIRQEDPELGEHMHTNAAGQAKYCYEHGMIVERRDLQPGDLVFWTYKDCKGCHRWKEIHHVGIYAGDGKVVEAAGDKGRVVIRKLWKTKECPIIFYGRPY